MIKEELLKEGSKYIIPGVIITMILAFIGIITFTKNILTLVGLGSIIGAFFYGYNTKFKKLETFFILLTVGIVLIFINTQFNLLSISLPI